MNRGSLRKRNNTMQIKTSPRNRKCKYPRCKNILSVYNHEAYCNVHLKAAFWKDKVDGVPADNPESDILKISRPQYGK